MKNELINIEETIESKIYTIRGLQVMLDRDLAELYEVKPIRLREQVRRNISKFPDDFMFELSDDEADLMVSQNAIPSRGHLGGSLPLVFTEQGVSMLATVLKSPKATQVSINIMRAFVAMRKFLLTNAGFFERFERVEERLLIHDQKLNKLFQTIESRDHKPDQGIFFDGQIYDAYAFVNELINPDRLCETL